MNLEQRLNQPFERRGVGLHSGAETRVRVSPAPPGSGRYFVRVDLPDAPGIPATTASVISTTLSTELGISQTIRVRTGEHLLAALMGLGIEDACVEIDGPEVPLLDGSAQNWVEGILEAGVTPAPPKPTLPPLTKPLWIYEGDAFVAAVPAPAIRFSYGIDFDLPAIGNQWHSWSPEQSNFAQDIAPARTFGLAHQIEQLRQAGLIKGGSLDNALVCGEQGWLNPPLRFPNEPVRHKILDLVGDLALVGVLPQAHYLAYKASHSLHTQLAKLIQREGVGCRV